jgi:hypothetical protein
MSNSTRRLRSLAFARQFDIAALTAMLAAIGGWLMFWFGE